MVETGKSAPTLFACLSRGQERSFPEDAGERPRQAATTRGAGSTASEGSAGLLSIVTSEKPTAFS